MKILIVLAHPSIESLNALIFKHIQERCGTAVKSIDLYRVEFRREITNMEYRGISTSTDVIAYQEIIKWSDLIIFIYSII